MRNMLKHTVKTTSCTAAILLACAMPSFAQKTNSPKKHTGTPAHRRDLEQEIDALRKSMNDLQNKVDAQQQQLEQKGVQLEKAEQKAVEAQSEAANTHAQLADQQQSVKQNDAAVDSLKASLSSLSSSQASLAATFTGETAKIKSAIGTPDALHYRGISFYPYGFFTMDAGFRSHATGGELATPWSSLPYEHADAYTMSETAISGRQSRIGIIAETKVPFGKVRAVFEADFLGAGATSNNNQSSSYLLRQRIALAEAETTNHWVFSGGQGWSLTEENRSGISTAAANMALPGMVDPNYVAGLVWSRQGFVRVGKSFNKVAVAVAAENPQLLYTATLAGNTPYAVVGSGANGGSALNSGIGSCSPSTVIVNYTNQSEQDSAGNTTDVAVPVYKTLNSCANLANISFGRAPDMIVKVAMDPGFGHYEIYGVGRTFHEMVYPGETTNSNLYGGLTDIVTGQAVAPALTTKGSYSQSVFLGGIGASLRIPLIKNRFVFGAKVLFGPGVGHFAASNLSDATSNAAGQLVPIHNLSGLLTAEVNVTPRISLYGYYGGDYAGRVDEATSVATTLGAPTAYFCVTGTSTCTTSPTADQIAAGGKWGAHWGAPAAAALGYGSRLLSNSACNTNSAPGYNGSSTGYYAGASCGAQIRNVQESTVGYWYDVYKGDRTRFRQGIQYSYAVREGWSGAGGIGAKGVDNMLFASFRFILP